MSAKNQVICIQPMMFVGDGNREERMESKGHVCSGCSGNGWHWGEDKQGEQIKRSCSACKGSGRLDANITIEWNPGG